MVVSTDISIRDENFTETGVMWQMLIHLTFIVSAIGIAYVERLGQSVGERHEPQVSSRHAASQI